MANHTIYCRIPTPQEKKEMERQEQERKQKQEKEQAEARHAAHKKRLAEIGKELEKQRKQMEQDSEKRKNEQLKAKWQAAIKQNQAKAYSGRMNKGKAYSELSADERRNVDRILQQYNQQVRKRYGLGEEYAGVEFR